jgi:hypothetical protein
VNIQIPVEKAGTYVLSQHLHHPGTRPVARPHLPNPAITIAHQAGAGVKEIAAQAAQLLGPAPDHDGQRWAVYDRQIIEKALEDHRWPKALAEKITEEKRFFVDELMDELCGGGPPSWLFLPQMMETILHLAVNGHVILVGHGATAVTAQMTNVFHVRLTGSLPRRIERVRQARNLTPAAAAKAVKQEDRARSAYVKTHFHARLADELLYDLVLNTDRISDDDAAAVIAGAAQNFFAAQ